MVDENEQKAFYGKIEACDIVEVSEMLLHKPELVHARLSYDHRTPLIHSVMNAMEWAETEKGKAQIGIIAVLLKAGSDPNAKTDDGRNALAWAAGFAVGSSPIIRNKDEAGRIAHTIVNPKIREIFEGIVGLLLEGSTDLGAKAKESLQSARSLLLSVIPDDPTPPINGRFALPLKEGIFVDVDGTLIGPDGKLNTELYEKLRIAEELGYKITVISGGYIPMQEQRLKELGVKLKCLDVGVSPKSSNEREILEFLIDDVHPGSQKLTARCYEKPEDAFTSDYEMAVRVRKRVEGVKAIASNPLAGDGVTSDAKKLTTRSVPERPVMPTRLEPLKAKG